MHTSPAKKPSYLNLACCVNGYSNLTTYDSKLRQNINKSREVSPIRPIIHTLQYNRGEGGQYLVVPVPVPVAAAIANDTSKMDTRRNNLISPDKRYYQSQKTTTNSSVTTTRTSEMSSKDVTDNVNYFKSMNLTSIARDEAEIKSPKSFIQQRVERLYGPGALAQGFYSPKRSNSDSNSSVLSERSQNSTITVHNKIFKTEYRNGVAPISSQTPLPTVLKNVAESENVNFVDSDNHQDDQLPVLRHLRPEFRAQLPILSPKRQLNKLPTDFAMANGKAVPIPSEIVATSACDTIYANNTYHGHHQQKLQENYNTQSITKTSTITNTTAASVVVVTPQAHEKQSHVTTNNDSCSSQQMNGAIIGVVSSEEINCESVNKMKISDENGQESVNGLPVEILVLDNNLIKSNGLTNGAIVKNGNTNNCTARTIKDGLYFLNILNIERDRLIALAVKAENYMESLTEVSYSYFYQLYIQFYNTYM